MRKSSSIFEFTTKPRYGRIPVALWVVMLLVLVGGAGVYYWGFGRSAPVEDVQKATVERGAFTLEVTEKGDLESSGNTEIRCEVKSAGMSGTSIIKIVPEGTVVQQGDFIVQLDSSKLELDQAQQQIAVNTSEALVVQANNTYETALIAKEEYLKGTFNQEKQLVQSEIFVSEENLRRARQYLQYSRRLAASGYITQLQLDADAFAVENARNGLDASRTKLNVLENFTRAKMLKTLESAIVTAKAQWEAEKKSHSVELAKLKEIDDQIGKCLINAPGDGQVKYAHKTDFRGNNEFVIEEGSLVREHQVIVSLPDSKRMQVKINVGESVLENIREGMPAMIRSVALNETVLPGSVAKINQYSEPSSWRKGDVKEFGVYVQVDQPDGRLLPGMTAEVTIRCLDIDDALKVPVQAVYSHGDRWYAFVERGETWEAKEITPGANNEMFVTVNAGLAAGDVVTLNPRKYLDQVSLPELSAAEQQQIVRRNRLPSALAKAGDAKSGSAPKAKTSNVDGDSPPSPAAIVGRMLASMDTNGDGLVSSEEMPAAMRERLSAADTNGDGSLDRAELTSAVSKFRGGPPGDGAPGNGPAGAPPAGSGNLGGGAQ